MKSQSLEIRFCCWLALGVGFVWSSPLTAQEQESDTVSAQTHAGSVQPASRIEGRQETGFIQNPTNALLNDPDAVADAFSKQDDAPALPGTFTDNELRTSTAPVPQFGSSVQGNSAALTPLPLSPTTTSDPATTFGDPASSPAAPLALLRQTEAIIRDSATEPAAWQQPTTPQSLGGSNPAAPSSPLTRTNASVDPAADAAGRLLSEIQLAAQRELVQYQPMGLDDMLANCQHHERKAMIEQYWIAWRACAEYLFAADEATWLSRLEQPRNETDRVVINSARSLVSDVMNEKAIAMSEELHKLNTFLTGPRSEVLPWPIDKPMTGRYTTHYAEFASRGMGSETLRMVDELLPRQRELLLSRAGTVERCRAAIGNSIQAFRQTGTGSATMLQALWLVRESHSGFLQSVSQYNQLIARYALTVKPDESSNEKVVAMLLPSELPAASYMGDSGIRQASLQSEAAGPGMTGTQSSSPAYGGGYGGYPSSNSGTQPFNNAPSNLAPSNSGTFVPASGAPGGIPSPSSIPPSLQPRSDSAGSPRPLTGQSPPPPPSSNAFRR